MKNLIAAILCCLFFLTGIAQQEETPTEKLSREANKFFKSENYRAALPMYLDLLKEAPNDAGFLLRAGICYLRTNIDKAKAVPYFEKLLDKKTEDPSVYLLAGSAYQYAYEFDTAITQYLFYLKEMKPSEENIDLVKRKIETCENAKELMKFPRNITFENLGKSVNSEYPDYSPFIPQNESFVMFNSRRAVGKDLKGYSQPNVYISYVRNGAFQPSRMITSQMSKQPGKQEVVGLSGDGHTALLFYRQDGSPGNIFLGHIRGDKVDSLTLLPASINAPESIEAAASLSADGRTIYFASNRLAGFGGFDIYATRMLPTGEWSMPENLGPAINTVFDEDFPNISPDGKTLYFSSKGHTTMGGYDIFEASRENEDDSWSNVKNMGVPINSPDDDMNFRVSANGRYGYISTLRNDGFGDLDIYRITFNDVDPSFTVIKGNIYTTGMQKVSAHVTISIDNAETMEHYGQYQPNPVTGRYIIILPPGKYFMEAQADDGSTFKELLIVFDKSSYVPEIEKNIMLKK